MVEKIENGALEPANLARFLDLAKLIEKANKEVVKPMAKELIKAGGEVPGYKIVQSRTGRSIPSILGAQNALSDYVSTTAIYEACKISVAKLVKLSAKRYGAENGCSASAAMVPVEELLAGENVPGKAIEQLRKG